MIDLSDIGTFDLNATDSFGYDHDEVKLFVPLPVPTVLQAPPSRAERFADCVTNSQLRENQNKT